MSIEQDAARTWAEFPARYARTRRFTNGAPRQVTVTSDGSAVFFLRSASAEESADQLWVFDPATGAESLLADPAKLPRSGGDADLPAAERAMRERLRLVSGGIGAFAVDAAGAVAVFAYDGELFRADRRTGEIEALPTAGPVFDPRVDASGKRVAYVSDGTLHVLDAAGDTAVSPAEPEGVSWGMADFIAAEEFHRFRGYWWSPDGGRLLTARVDESGVPKWHLHDPAEPGRAATSVAYPPAGGINAIVEFYLVTPGESPIAVRWDSDTYPYVVTAEFSGDEPVLSVLDRRQQRGQVLRVAATGETTVLAELTDSRWIEMVPGSPAVLPSGELAVVRDGLDQGKDVRAVHVGDRQITSDELYVQAILGVLGEGDAAELLVLATDDPAEQHVYAVAADGSGAPRRITTERGVHTAVTGGGVLAVGSAAAEGDGTVWTVRRGESTLGTLRSMAAPFPYAPRPRITRVTERRLPAGVLYPSSHVPGTPLPVLVNVYGGPGHQMVRAQPAVWLERQWWAESGFAVVSIDNRGTTGVSPGFEKAMYQQVTDVVLPDQVDALKALAAEHPDLDMSRVAIRGWSFGGYMSALAVLARPDVFTCGIAGAPVTDWALYDTAYTERYLGLPDDPGGVYAKQSLIELAKREAPGGRRNPLLLVHGMADDNVVAAHTLRLSAELLQQGHPHSVLPLPGATHMVTGELARHLAEFELDFVRTHLGSSRPAGR
ncbi:prolyl oligopeptidase family serine peptidase [Actinoplanes sp. NPDC024001]|uniref:S9 family peptidase n=1 Tax=Actinoplanes sp. NPDC024001 TaxID=3154598 RepID=UPI0033DB2219